MTSSSVTAATRFLEVGAQRYAYRRFGAGPGQPLLCLQHFTGTLDNWDPAVADPLARGREVILFENAGIGRSTGSVPTTIAGMAQHAFAFLDALKLSRCDVLGYSLGGMIAQQMALDRPAIFRRMLLVGTAPRGGEDIMHLEKPACRFTSAIRRFVDTRSWVRSSLHPPNQARPQLTRSLSASGNVHRIANPFLDPQLHKRRWPPFANGSHLRECGSALSRQFLNPRLS